MRERKRRSSSIFSKEGRVSMSTLWNSLSCPNIVLLWSPIQKTEWAILRRGCWRTYKRECQSIKLHDNMNISHLMVYWRRVEEARSKWKSRYAKRASSFDEGSSKNRFEIQDKPKFKKRVSTQVPYKFPRSSGDRVSKPKFNKGKGTNSSNQKPTCRKSGKKHYANFLKGKDNCFSCDKSGNKMRDCPNLNSQDKGSGQEKSSGFSDAPKKNLFLCSPL